MPKRRLAKKHYKKKNKVRVYETEYEVEDVIDKKVINGSPFYKIKWLGYPVEECTWEPLENLSNITMMIDQFEGLELPPIEFSIQSPETRNFSS